MLENIPEFGLGRARLSMPFTLMAASGGADVASPVFCSTRTDVLDVDSNRVPRRSLLAIPYLNDPALCNLIMYIAQQVAYTLISVQSDSKGKQDNGAHTQNSGASQSHTDTPSISLSGMYLVMQPDVREPPVFRGDRFTVHKWEEVVDVILRK